MALTLNPNYGMALGNKGIALCYYSRLMGKYWKTILIDAHYFISKALKLGVNIEARESFIIWLNWIRTQFPDKSVLDTPPKFPGYEIKASSEFERFLMEYCMENQLYLNICTFCQKCNAAIGDNINIELINSSNENLEKDKYLLLFRYLNQIKEDYIAARFLLILSRYGKYDLDYVYNNVKFVNTLNNEYKFDIQLVRLSFKSFYDILDKIAFFINE